MSTAYKVWLQIEKLTGPGEDWEEFENIGEPEEVTCCQSLEQAESEVMAVLSPGPIVENATENFNCLVEMTALFVSLKDRMSPLEQDKFNRAAQSIAKSRGLK